MTLKQFLNHHCRVMLGVFNLSHYSVKFYRMTLEDSVAMEISVDHEYLRAEISYSYLVSLMWQQHRYKDIKQTLAHEIVHILLPKCNEATVEHVSRLFYELYEKNN